MVQSSRRQFLGIAGLSAGISGRTNVFGDPLIGEEIHRRKHMDVGTDDLFIDVPGYPSNPFVITEFGAQYFNDHDNFGWSPEPPREERRTILKLHPDVQELNPLTQFKDGRINTISPGQLDFALDVGLPSTAGWNINIKIGEKAERYRPIMERNAWSYPDGRALDSPDDILARKFDGTPQFADYTDMGVPSVFAPGCLDLLVEVTAQRLEQGFTGIWIDDIVYFRRYGLDFSPWARVAFQDHLGSLSDTRLAELGIDRPMSFDIKRYLKDQNLTPQDAVDPRQDAVFREYQLHHHLGIKNLFGGLRRATRDRFPERTKRNDIKFFGNLGLGVGPKTLRVGATRAPSVYSNDHFELINTELFPTVRNHNYITYKLLLAIGNYRKVAKTKGTLAEPPSRQDREDLDPESHYPMLQRFQVAEAYAMGVIQKLPLTTITFSADESITHWIRGDGSVSDRLQTFIDFLWAHKRMLTATNPANPVAVVFSLPDRIWHYVPQWGIEKTAEQALLDSFAGSGAILHGDHIPFDTLVFGHPKLWDDTLQLDRLADYEAVVLPAVRTVTERQLSALHEYVRADGTVIVSGDPPSRTAGYNPRSELHAVFDHENVVVLESNPGKQQVAHGQGGRDLLEALHASGITSVSVDDVDSLTVNRVEQSDPSRMIIHALNREYSRESDRFTPREDVRLRVSKPAWDIGAARYYSPQGTQDLDVADDGETVTVVIPELVEWGFVVFVGDPSHLSGAVSEAEASERVSAARQRLEAARESGRNWSLPFVNAEVHADSAEMALEYGAYDQAEQAAREAISDLERTYPQPTIGIDQVHGQPGSQEAESPFSWLEDAFPRYQFSLLTDWSQGALEEVDVLFIPPALAFKGERHGFTEAEVDRIESFVSNGGSLLILARGGVAEDIDVLTRRFGYEYQGQPIVYPDDEDRHVDTIDRLHELTQSVSDFYAQFGTPIESYPDDATVLASVPEDSSAWLHEENLDSRDEGEASAAGAPIYSVSTHGSGYVVVLGTHRYLYPNELRNRDVLMGNLLEVLGREAARTRYPTGSSPSTVPPSADTPTQSGSSPTSRADSEPEPNQSIGVNSPGFTIMAGIAGVATAIAARLLRNPGREG